MNMQLLAGATREIWRGLDCTRLALDCGDSLRVSDFGAQALSWQVQGQERLFLSPQTVLDGSFPIRGGIPICFPQFNRRGGLPKHGIARRQPWRFVQASGQADRQLHAQWRWQHSADTQAMWPAHIAASVHVSLQPGQLQVVLEVENLGDAPWPFTAALHSYLRVDQVGGCRLQGLEGRAYWDTTNNAMRPAVQQGALAFGTEVDRVYPGSSQPLRLEGGLPSTLAISQDAAWGETVVWNPGEALCAQLEDMAPDSWQHMLCVEAAHINQPVALLPGTSWRAGQTLQVL
ncbi:D-hexose-6-phosphate mutarotase [Comamonas sp. GB3 AK4-5]|uniref:D-hexose-6-phosphate mutarotase n=1 Tax=Comamonas sp. GB3 AK4-5 TaxID=3231487 RepID=UPI00351E0704